MMRHEFFEEARTVGYLMLAMLVVLLAMSIAQHPVEPDTFLSIQAHRIFGIG